MRDSGKRILDHYEEGRITATGAILRVLDLKEQEEMREAIELLPADLLERLKDFVRRYRPAMLIFPGPPPRPRAVKMAIELLADPVKSPA
jgi:hypothetical protein